MKTNRTSSDTPEAPTHSYFRFPSSHIQLHYIKKKKKKKHFKNEYMNPKHTYILNKLIAHYHITLMEDR